MLNAVWLSEAESRAVGKFLWFVGDSRKVCQHQQSRRHLVGTKRGYWWLVFTRKVIALRHKAQRLYTKITYVLFHLVSDITSSGLIAYCLSLKPPVQVHLSKKQKAYCGQRKDGTDDEDEDEVDAETLMLAFSLPAQGEDRPCFVKWFLPAELFSRYQSKIDHWEITQRIACIPTFPWVTLEHSLHSKSISLLPFQ